MFNPTSNLRPSVNVTFTLQTNAIFSSSSNIYFPINSLQCHHGFTSRLAVQLGKHNLKLLSRFQISIQTSSTISTMERWKMESKAIASHSNPSLQPDMASAFPCPSRPSQGCHPLRPLLLPELLLHPPCHLSPLPCFPCLRRYHTHPGQKTLSLCSNHARAQKSPVLAHYHAQLPLQLWSASRPAQVLHPALSTGLNQSV